MAKATALNGRLQIGTNGKETALFSALVEERVDLHTNLLLSAENRHVWLVLSPSDKVKLANLLLGKSEQPEPSVKRSKVFVIEKLGKDGNWFAIWHCEDGAFTSHYLQQCSENLDSSFRMRWIP